MPRGAYWADEEVAMLLAVLRASRGLGRIVRSSCLPTKAIFRRAARTLECTGYHRTPGQCRAKFKKIKGAFYKALEDYGEHPTGATRPPFFRLFRELWVQAGRPTPEERLNSALRRRRREEMAAEESSSDSSGDPVDPPQPVYRQQWRRADLQRQPEFPLGGSSPEAGPVPGPDSPTPQDEPTPLQGGRALEHPPLDLQRQPEFPSGGSSPEAGPVPDSEDPASPPHQVVDEPILGPGRGAAEHPPPALAEHPLDPLPGNRELYDMVLNLQRTFSVAVSSIDQRIRRVEGAMTRLEALVNQQLQGRGRGRRPARGRARGHPLPWE